MKVFDFLKSRITPDPRPPTLRERPIRSNHVEMRRFAEDKRACEDPVGAVKDMCDGKMSPRAAEAVRAVYPRLFQQMQEELIETISAMDTLVPFPRLVRAALVFPDLPLDTKTSPTYLASRQGEYDEARQQAPAQPPTGGGAQLRLSNQEELGGRRAMR
jgi:hypothetical protein